MPETRKYWDKAQEVLEFQEQFPITYTEFSIRILLLAQPSKKGYPVSGTSGQMGRQKLETD